MKILENQVKIFIVIYAVLLLTVPLTVFGQQQTAAEHVTAIKQSLAKSAEQIKQYKWTETTSISVEDEEKFRFQSSCAYGEDGKVQKTNIDTLVKAEEKGGLRGLIAKRKKEKMQEYMKKAVSLVHNYVPVSPGRLQILADDEKVSVKILEVNKRVQIQFNDYQKSGDMVGIELDIVADKLLGYEVNSYIDDPDEPVNLNVKFAYLDDGTLYPGDIVLEATAKDVTVNVKNADHTK